MNGDIFAVVARLHFPCFATIQTLNASPKLGQVSNRYTPPMRKDRWSF
jgi:hypothetical protein